MESSPLDLLWTSSSGAQTAWTVVWLVMAAITITIVMLMYTRWGRSRALEKCAVLSALAHMLLAGVATSVKLASSAPASAHSDHDELAVAQFLGTLTDEGEDAPPKDDEGKRAGLIDAGGDPASAAALAAAVAPDSTLDRPEADAASAVRTVSATSDQLAPPLAENVDRAEQTRPRVRPLAQDDAIMATHRAAAEPIERGEAAKSTSDPVVDTTADATTPVRPAQSIAAPIERSLDDPRDDNVAALPRTVGDRSRTPTASDLDQPELPRRVAVDSGATSIATGVESGSAPRPNESLAAAAVAATSIAERPGRATRGAGGEMPEIYKARTAPNRGQIASRGGGSAETEAAVDHALLWLVAHQSRDGRWESARLEGGLEPRTAGHDRQGAGIGADTGVTGLALLAFLGAGQTHLKGEHRETVRRGLEFLIRSQDQQGSLAGEARLFARMYCHGMAGLALSEALAMTDDARLEDAVRRAVAYSTAAQHAGTGGWRYLPSESGDMSQHGWQVMVLKSAQLAGVEVNSLAVSRASRFVDSATSGRYGGLGSYRPREKVSSAMTAEAMVCRRFLEMRRDEPMTREASDQLTSDLPTAERPNFYYWYYGTLAMHDVQGEGWKQWNKSMQKALLEMQRASGDAGGSWDPDPVWGGYGGRVYSTALGALCLEVYYRYLPLYKQEAATRTADPATKQGQVK